MLLRKREREWDTGNNGKEKICQEISETNIKANSVT
jgi:hypothetical protein